MYMYSCLLNKLGFAFEPFIDSQYRPMAAQYEENNDEDIEGKRAITYEVTSSLSILNVLG